MTQQPPPERVRVTGPPRRRPAGTRTREIDAETRVGAIFMGSLLGEQFRLALRILGTLFLTVGILPLLFHLFPGLGDVRLAGVPLAWVLLGVLVYPYLLFLGWRYVVRAEANERDFAALVEEVER
jgi:hypothetical protein